MKTISLIALASLASALALAIACTRGEDTNARAGWPRAVEARLAGVAWQRCEEQPLRGDRVVPEVRCGTAAPMAECPANLKTPDDAVHALFTPRCTKQAVAALELFARTDNAAAADLAAAYYVRAQRDDRPSDFLRALRTAEEALLLRPDSPELRFDIALAQEAIGQFSQAAISWNAYLAIDRTSPWAEEARQHVAALPPQPDESEAARVARAQTPMAAALRANDPQALARAIASYPLAAQRYLDERLLAEWAQSPSPEKLELARRMAAGLSRHGRDPFPTAEIAAIDRAAGSPATLQALQRGHAAYAKAATDATPTPNGCADAARELARGGSPLQLLADARALNDLLGAEADAAKVLDRIPAVIEESRRSGYRAPLVFSQGVRAASLFALSRYVEALRAYDDQLATARQMRDVENEATIRVRRGGQLQVLGDREGAWRETVASLVALPQVTKSRDRHAILGQAAVNAVNLDAPRTAVDYSNAAVRLARKDGRNNRLVSALRERAAIELQLGRRKEAAEDLREGFRLAADLPHADSYESRLREVEGQFLFDTEPARAADAFTTAFMLGNEESATYQAGLLVECAQAELRASRVADAECDLGQAIAVVHAEEAEILAHRKAGEAEEVWSGYFSRFQDTYRLLIAKQLEARRAADAFLYSEQARTTEPFDLAARRGVASPALRGMTVDRIRALLPPNTFLIEYCVLEKETYAWIVARDHFEVLPLGVERRDVRRWTADLQQAANDADVPNFEASLDAPYQRLIRKPLARIREWQPGVLPNLVIVADDAIHGLPIAALRDAQAQQYLLEQTASIASSGSAALYLSSLERDHLLGRDPSPSILLVGDPAFDQHAEFLRGYARLPAAREEVGGIASMYGSRAEPLNDVAATTANVLEHARRKSILHIAAHSIANADFPFRSLLLLAASGDDPGAVTARELVKQVNLDRTRLVVLSSCSSAGGLPIGPEGVGPLVRPWIAAGVPAVIGTLWDVEDATAGRLLVSFHRRYRQEGQNAAIALHNAQLQMRQSTNPGLASAISWGAFELIGHASSPSESPPHN